MNRAAWFNACCTNRNRAESRNWESGLWVRVFASSGPQLRRDTTRGIGLKGKIIPCLQGNSSPFTLAFYFLREAVMGSEVTFSTVCERPSFLNAAAQVRGRACGVAGCTEQVGLGATGCARTCARGPGRPSSEREK